MGRCCYLTCSSSCNSSAPPDPSVQPRFGCKIEVQYVVRYETYGEVSNEGKGQEVEDEKAEMAGKEAPKTARSALNSLYFKLLFSR